MTNAAAALRTQVLVVEDDPDAREIYEGTLRWAGYDVMTVGSIAEARRLVVRRRPDLVILDCQLPDGRGVELLALWKQTPAMARVPVVIVTAFAQDHDVQAAVRAGVDGLLVKPCWGHALLQKIADVLEAVAPTRKLPRYRLMRPPTLTFPAAADAPGPSSAFMVATPSSPPRPLDPEPTASPAFQRGEDGKLQACCVRCLRCSPMLGREAEGAREKVVALGWALRPSEWWCPVCIERAPSRPVTSVGRSKRASHERPRIDRA
jgi:CheY-like chemotaxis protein